MHWSLNIQIRSRNEFLLSNWSDPIPIREPSASNRPVSEPPVAVIASVTVVAFVVLVIAGLLLAVLLYFCYYRRKIVRINKVKIIHYE